MPPPPCIASVHHQGQAGQQGRGQGWMQTRGVARVGRASLPKLQQRGLMAVPPPITG